MEPRTLSCNPKMIEPFLWVLWGLWIAQALISALNLIGFERARRKQDRKFQDLGAAKERPAALVVSIKGFDETLTPKFFKSVLTQNYGKYRAIITMESEDEPIVEWLRDQLELEEDQTVWQPENPEKGLQEIVMVFAGQASDMGQKVHNQIEAFKHLTDADEIIAFADADIACNTDWLSSLLAPINIGEFQLSTTYRWLVPTKHTIANVFASVINSSVATMSGRGVAMTWGGSMALTRDAFNDLDLPKLFSGCLNDDLRLGRAARRGGYKIASLRSLITPSPVHYSWFSFLEFARRQYYQVKHFTPILFLVALCFTGLYTAGFISAVVAVWQEYFYAWIPIACVTVFDQIRALARARIIRNLFDDKTAAILDDTSVIEHWFTPLWMMIHFFTVVLAVFARKITWAGITYRVISPNRTKILNRKEPLLANPVPPSQTEVESAPLEDEPSPAQAVLPEVIPQGEPVNSAALIDEKKSEVEITASTEDTAKVDSEPEETSASKDDTPSESEQKDHETVETKPLAENEATPDETATAEEPARGDIKSERQDEEEETAEEPQAITDSSESGNEGDILTAEPVEKRKRTGFPFTDESIFDDIDLPSTHPREEAEVADDEEAPVEDVSCNGTENSSGQIKSRDTAPNESLLTRLPSIHQFALRKKLPPALQKTLKRKLRSNNRLLRSDQIRRIKVRLRKEQKAFRGRKFRGK